MQIYWNAQLMGQVFVLPSAVVQQHLRLAGPVQLKVLLWLAAQGDGRFDAAACAKAIGKDQADCEDALQYWIETGVVCVQGQAAPAVCAAKPEPPPAVRAVPRAVKPQMEQVLKLREQYQELGVLFDSVSARLGKPLSPADMETLAYLFDTAGLPVEVILMVVGWAAEQDKLNMRYIEKTALGWADQGLTDITAAEQYLCALEKERACSEQIRALFGLEAPLTRAQSAQTVQWLTEWEMSEELLLEAKRQCVEKIGKCQINYIHKMLAHWYEDGVSEIGQVRAVTAKKSKAPRSTSMDIDAYEQQLQTRIPVFKKRKV